MDASLGLKLRLVDSLCGLKKKKDPFIPVHRNSWRSGPASAAGRRPPPAPRAAANPRRPGRNAGRAHTPAGSDVNVGSSFPRRVDWRRRSVF